MARRTCRQPAMEGNYYSMQEGFHLTHLDIGHNALVRMDRQALQSSLREVSKLP